MIVQSSLLYQQLILFLILYIDITQFLNKYECQSMDLCMKLIKNNFYNKHSLNFTKR